jgi:2-phospho-L-lactate guanylyltransferase
MLELFGHVSEVLASAGLRVVALSPAPLPSVPGEVWIDEEPGLNRAVARALERLGPPALVVHADLPWLRVVDVERLLAEPGDVVVARAHDGGTNALLLRRLMPPAFGRDSALVHAIAARERGLRARVVDIDGLARDLDDASALSAACGRVYRRP